MGNVFVNGGGIGDIFQIAQVHFHWGHDDKQGSEHTIDGNKFPLEVNIIPYRR